MVLRELEDLSTEMKLALQGALANYQIQGSFVSKSLSMRLAQKKKVLNQRITEANKGNAAVNGTRKVVRQVQGKVHVTRLLDKDTYAVRMLKLIGAELHARYGDDAAAVVFAAAKSQLSDSEAPDGSVLTPTPDER